MKEKKPLTQIGIKLHTKQAEALQRMANESGESVTTVAKRLLYAAIRQAELGESTMPPYLRRFYGDDVDLPSDENE